MSASHGESLSGEVTGDLPEFSRPPAEPLGLIAEWLEAAAVRGVREPSALVLATACGRGLPSSRVVLLKRCGADGLEFTTDHASRKGRELAANPYASGTLYWRETLQQINVAGPVERISDEEADALFAERPRAGRAATAVSDPSSPLHDEEALRAAARTLAAADGDIPRPEHWGGYRLRPDEVEFWCGRPDRLHRRLHYTRGPSGWAATRLQP